MKKVLITGGSGLLGNSMIRLNPGKLDIHATYHSAFSKPNPNTHWHKVDLADEDALKSLIDTIQPDAIVHAGTIGSVDFAEKNREISYRINVDATRIVAESAERLGAHMIFLSSNAVFNGEKPPYSEDDPVSPVNYYGELKVLGEEVTREFGGLTSIVRPILMYGWPNEGRRGNLVTFWLSKLEAGEEIVAVNDVWSKPLWVDDASKTCWAVLNGRFEGTFNVCGGERVTLHGLASAVARNFGFDLQKVKAVPSSYFGDIANRPKDTSFTNEKIQKVLGINPLGVDEGLAAMSAAR